MTKAETALRTFARQAKLRVTACNHFNPNVGERARHKVTLWYRDNRVTVRAAVSLLEVEIRFEDGVLVFAVNVPDRISLLDRPLTTQVVMALFVGRADPGSAVSQWLAEPNHSRLLNSLVLGPREAVTVYRNGVTAVFESERDLDVLIPTLGALVGSLPRVRASVGVRELPQDLRPLARYFFRWSVADDELRNELLARATTAHLHALVTEVGPLLNRIDSYLASFGTEPLPNVAVQLGQLAELVAEVRAREA